MQHRPAQPVQIAETGLLDWPAAQALLANGDTVFHHDCEKATSVSTMNLLFGLRSGS